ncbi:hypothetical protein KKF05_03245 [Patescibacteria group bacterium]|nr:hypothetical protein [Patescibacteria group bacterium]MBU1028871.1 hypothetical protein [Patescibacteria group bacterium]MBU1915636.1 hypothetical protein [Patescibacteria group bacterium]
MYQVVAVSSQFDVLVLEDLDDARHGRPDRFWLYDRNYLFPDRDWREERADQGETARVFRRIAEDELSLFWPTATDAATTDNQSNPCFSNVADAWRWLRLKQLAVYEQNIARIESWLHGDPYNTQLIESLNLLSFFRNALRRRLGLSAR